MMIMTYIHGGDKSLENKKPVGSILVHSWEIDGIKNRLRQARRIVSAHHVSLEMRLIVRTKIGRLMAEVTPMYPTT